MNDQKHLNISKVILTNMRSKEEKALEPFFNIPKHWHFEELHKAASISKPQLSYWLKRYERQGLVKKIKPKGKMPYYVAVQENPDYQIKKRMYAMNLLTDVGLLSHLSALKGAKVVILFGSFSRWDWYKDSDIDIFVYGSDDDFEQGKYELKLNREIQVHNAKDKTDLKRIDRMIPYIIAGDFIKGSIEDLGVKIEAKV